MNKCEESSPNCVSNLIRANPVAGNQNNTEKLGFSLHNLNTGLGKVRSGSRNRPVYSFSPHFGALLNFF